jgi:hypothetical protein
MHVASSHTAIRILNAIPVLINQDFQFCIRKWLRERFVQKHFNSPGIPIVVCCQNIVSRESLKKESLYFVTMSEYIKNGPFCGSGISIRVQQNDKVLVSDLSLSSSEFISNARIFIRIASMVENFQTLAKVTQEAVGYGIRDDISIVEAPLYSIKEITHRILRTIGLRSADWRVNYRRTELNSGRHFQTIQTSLSTADPFLACIEGEEWLLFEGFKRGKEYGKIYGINLTDKITVQKPKLLLDVGSHISYPFCWQEGDETFILPEMVATGSMAIFKYCKETKTFREFRTLDIPETLLDPNYIAYPSGYLIIGTRSILGDTQGGGVLVCYTSQDKYGPWELSNPILIWSDFANRNAGIQTKKGDIEFFAQSYCKGKYGHHVSSYKLSDWTRGIDNLEIKSELEPDTRIHHFSISETYLAFDVFK